MTVLTVKSPFLTYKIGDQITDPDTVAMILDTSEYSDLVIQSGTAQGSGGGGSPPSPGPTQLLSTNGNVTVDNTTIAITNDRVLHVIPSTTGSSGVISQLGYTPVNVASVGMPNGLATLTSAGKLPISQLTPAVVGALNYAGTWNALTNTPGLLSGSGTKGVFYKVTVAGNTPLDGHSFWNVGDFIAYNGTEWDKLSSNSAAQVLAFNERVGAITLLFSDVTAALGFTPYNAANPSNYINSTQVANFSPVRSFNTRTGAIVLSSSDITTALTFTPYNSTNPAGYVNSAAASLAAPIQRFNTRTGNIVLTSADVTNALNFTPYNATNPNNYISADQLPESSVISVAGRSGIITLTTADITNLPRVGVTGAYGDLTNKPIIPSATSQLTNDAGFITAATGNVLSVNGLTGNIVLKTASLENDAGFVTATTTPVRSVNGLGGDVSLPQQVGTLMDLAVSSLTNDLHFISSDGLGTLNISNCLVTVNSVTQTIAQWFSQLFQISGHIVNDTGGLWYLEDGSVLSY